MLIRIVGLTALKNSTAFELLVHIGRVNDKNKIDREKCRSLHTLPSIANWYTLVQTNGRARADDLLQGLIELVRLRVCPRLSSIFNSLSSSRTIHTAIEGTRVYFFFSHMPILFPPPPSAYVFFALLFSGRSKVTSRKNCKQPTMCVFLSSLLFLYLAGNYTFPSLSALRPSSRSDANRLCSLAPFYFAAVSRSERIGQSEIGNATVTVIDARGKGGRVRWNSSRGWFCNRAQNLRFCIFYSVSIR